MTQTSKAKWQAPSRLCDVARPQAGFGDAIALSGFGESITYAQLDRRIDAARGAYADLGLVPGERVVLLFPTSVEFIITYFGAHRAGLVVIPLNPLLGIDEVRFVLSSMRPALVIAGPANAPFPVVGALDDLVAEIGDSVRFARLGENGAFDHALMSAPSNLPTVTRDADDEALILFTSGTSGRPKGASHREGAVIANAQNSNDVFGLSAQDVLICPLPLSHVFGQIVLMLGALMAGAELVLIPKPSPQAVLDSMIARHATMIAAVPTTFSALAELGRKAPDVVHSAANGLRIALAGGAPLPAAIGEAFSGVFGVPVHQGYGMTEVACCIAIEDPMTPPTGGVGKLCAPLRHRIVPVDVDKPDEGELELAGPNLFRGYYVDGILEPRPDAQWFPTGDLVRRDLDDNIFLFDRKKEMIIRNGYNVYPSEVEAALASHPDVLLAAVTGIPDAVVGQEVAAFVSVRDGADLTPEMLAQWCRARIALYKYPRLIAILTALPTNPTGKILKRALDPAALRRVELG